METITLTIPEMKSHHCQMTVTKAVNALGAYVKSITPAQAEIGLENGLTKESVVSAIENAGYKVTNN